jgi:class 3 adenylate cyclase
MSGEEPRKPGLDDLPGPLVPRPRAPSAASVTIRRWSRLPGTSSPTEVPEVPEQRVSRERLEDFLVRSSASRAGVTLKRVLHVQTGGLLVGALSTFFLLTAATLWVSASYVARQTGKTMVEEAKGDIGLLTAREAQIRSAPFQRIAAYARLLQQDQEDILARPELHPPPRGDLRLVVAPNGNAYKAEPREGGSLVLPARVPLDGEQRQLAQLTEAFDPLMERVVREQPDLVTGVYFNSASSLNRYVPALPDVANLFDPSVDARQFSFYYVADAAHDPEGLPRWTEPYLDPAGKGWVVTCAVPIRVGGRVLGVTGIDVALDALLRQLAESSLPDGGSALLASREGMLLALGKGLRGPLQTEGTHPSGIARPTTSEVNPAESLRVDRFGGPELRSYFARALASKAAPGEPAEELVMGQGSYLVSSAVLPETGWRFFYFSPESALLGPMRELESRGRRLEWGLAALFFLVGGAVLGLALRRSSQLAERIASPLVRLSVETATLGRGFGGRALEPVGIAEVDQLTANFGHMTLELADRQRAVVDARVRQQVQERSEELLSKVLPPSIVTRLMQGEDVVADRFESVTVLFADVVGFTPFAAALPPTEVVRVLEKLFSGFDELARKHGVEKIKTIGDAYMAVAGVPTSCPDHAQRAARLACDMLAALEPLGFAGSLRLRIGLHSGAAVAGVLGQDKFLYDLWGDTVNVASRLESHGQPGRIQVSEVTRALLGEGFQVEERGLVELKGRGVLRTFWLLGEHLDEAPVTERSGVFHLPVGPGPGPGDGPQG